MKSKNELKANHNRPERRCNGSAVGKYEVKERIESKSQLAFRIHRPKDCWQI